MAMIPDSDSRFLPCGRDSIDVWDDAAADRLNPHELTCRYCQAVAAECHRQAAALVAWRSQPAEPPATLVERVMAIVRVELRRRTALALPAGHGPASLDEAAASAALRFAADQVPAARVRSCRIRPRAPDPHEAPSPLGEDRKARTMVDIEVTMVVPAAHPVAVTDSLPAVAASVRQVMSAVATELLGLAVGHLDIAIVDLIDGRQR